MKNVLEKVVAMVCGIVGFAPFGYLDKDRNDDD